MSQASKTEAPIKAYEVINWLLAPDVDIPERFQMQKTKLVNIVPYLTEQLWLKPHLTWYLNKHANDLHKIPDPLEYLALLKKLFKMHRLTKWDLFQTRFEFKPKLIEAIEAKDGYDSNDATSKAMMMQRLNIPFDKYIKPAATKASVKANSDPKVNEMIKEALDNKNKAPVNTDTGVYITELSQQIIDEEELILFDISLLKRTNQILFIFIDKKNHKKYHLKPFMAKIYISKEDGVINNDYIEKLDPDKFMGYVINDVKLYTKLKYMLSHSYKRIINMED